MKLPAESQEDLTRQRTELMDYNRLAIPGGVGVIMFFDVLFQVLQ